MKLYYHENVDDLIKKLNTDEKNLLNSIIYMAGLHKKIITDTKVPTKLRQLVKKYTNNEITIDFFKRKKDSSGNWTIKKIILIVNPKEKK